MALPPPPVSTGAPPRRRRISTRGVAICVLFLIFIICVIGIIAGGTLTNTVVNISTVGSLLLAVLLAVARSTDIDAFFQNCDTFFGHMFASAWVLLRRMARACWTFSSRRRVLTCSLLLNIALIVVLLHPWTWFTVLQTQAMPCAGKDICVSMVGDEPVGISDGLHDFIGVSGHQRMFWTDTRSSNAERLIYQENQQAVSSSAFVTIVVLTTLTPGLEEGTGHDNLQGVYVLQHQINTGACKLLVGSTCQKLQVLVASAGNHLQYAQQVALQIVALPASDHMVGVVGFPYSTSGSVDGINILSKHKIIVISPSASSDALSSISPYFFRVVPPDSRQGVVAVQNVPPNTKKVAIFYAYNNLYSITLKTSFAIALQLQRPEIQVFSEAYQEVSDLTKENDEQAEIDERWRDARLRAPDFIFCACYSPALSELLKNVQDPQLRALNAVNVMAGDAAYDFSGYTPSDTGAQVYHDFSFTAFAFPDEWGTMNVGKGCQDNTVSDMQNFSCDYANDFDPTRKSLDPSNHVGPYGFTRAGSSVITTFDAARVLLQAYRIVASNGSVSSDEIRHVLLGLDECNEFQGLSGRIAFNPDGNPVDKALVILSVNSSGTATGEVQGEMQGTGSACNF